MTKDTIEKILLHNRKEIAIAQIAAEFKRLQNIIESQKFIIQKQRRLLKQILDWWKKSDGTLGTQFSNGPVGPFMRKLDSLLEK